MKKTRWTHDVSVTAMVYSSDPIVVQLVVREAGPLPTLVPVHMFGTCSEGKCTLPYQNQKC